MADKVFARTLTKWDKRGIELTKLVASWSKDPSSKCGAAIFDVHHRVLSVGFNGLPARVFDHDSRLEDRTIKYPLTIHAETNAILFAGVSLRSSMTTLYTWPYMPCIRCMALIIQAGIGNVVSPTNYWTGKENDIELTKQIFKESEATHLWLYDPKEL